MLKYRHTAALLAVLTILALPAAASAQRSRVDATRSREDVAKRGWIGIRPVFSLSIMNGKRTERMSVGDVVEGSPADRAGIRAGDQIVRINGRDADANALNALRDLQPGDTVRLRVAAGDRNRERDFTVIAEAQPPQAIAMTRVRTPLMIGPRDSVLTMARVFMDSAMRVLSDTTFFFRLDRDGPRAFVFPKDSLFDLHVFGGPDHAFQLRSREFEFPDIEFLGARSVSGAEFTEINEGLGNYFGTNEGLLVLKVAPGTPAARAGLEPGDVITRVNGRDVGTVMQLRAEVVRARGEPVKLDILRKGQRRSLNL